MIFYHNVYIFENFNFASSRKGRYVMPYALFQYNRSVQQKYFKFIRVMLRRQGYKGFAAKRLETLQAVRMALEAFYGFFTQDKAAYAPASGSLFQQDAELIAASVVLNESGVYNPAVRLYIFMCYAIYLQLLKNILSDIPSPVCS